MEFKLFILCTVFLILTVSASSSPQKQHSVAKFTFKMSENGTDYDEEVDIDEEKETETFHVPKVSPQKDSGDVIYDFKKNLTMFRVTEAKACFLGKSTLGALKPSDLKQLLVQVTRNGLKVVPRTEVKLKVVSTIDDRSDLSDEMANLCAKLPIYKVTEGEVNPNDLNGETGVGRIPAKRVKRGWLCRTVCGMLICRPACNYICAGLLCNFICRPVCSYGCKKVCG